MTSFTEDNHFESSVAGETSYSLFPLILYFKELFQKMSERGIPTLTVVIVRSLVDFKYTDEKEDKEIEEDVEEEAQRGSLPGEDKDEEESSQLLRSSHTHTF